MKMDDNVFWTGRAVILACINNQTKRFHTYVANRLAIIHAGSTPRKWKHVQSEWTPADDLPRRISVLNVIHSPRWFHSPEFLSQQSHERESQRPELELDNESEVKRTATAVHSTRADGDALEDLIDSRNPSSTRLRRSTACLFRYRSNLLAKVRGQKPPHSCKHLTSEELKDAEKTLIKRIQNR